MYTNHISAGNRAVGLGFNKCSCVLTLCGNNSIDCLVSIGCRGDVVVTLIKDISTLATICRCIVGGKILKAYCNLNGFGLTGCKIIGLCEADKKDGGFFYSTDIGCLTVNLNYFLTISATCVDNVKGNLNITVFISLGHIEVQPLECGIRKTIAEGINNSLGIIIVTNVFCTKNYILITSFVISVTNVNTLAVINVIIVGIGETEVTHILHSRRGEVIINPSVNKVTGGRNLVAVSIKTCHQIAKTVCSCSTCTGEVDNRTDVLIIANPTKLDSIVAVYKNDDIIKVFVKIRDNFKLGLIGLKVVLTGFATKGSHITSLVATLTACTGENEHCNSAVKGINNIRICCNYTERTLVDRPVKVCTVVDNTCATLIGRALTALIEVPKSFVYLKACTLKTCLQVGGKLKGA